VQRDDVSHLTAVLSAEISWASYGPAALGDLKIFRLQKL